MPRQSLLGLLRFFAKAMSRRATLISNMGFPSKSLIALLGAGLGPILPLNAIVVEITSPFEAASEYRLDFSVENNDSGAVYDSAVSDLLKDMATDIYSLGDNNVTYSSVDDMINTQFAPQVRAPPTGDSFTGWSASAINGGEISLNHNPGFIGLDYTGWDTDADSSKMALTSTVDYGLLELNNTSGHQKITDLNLDDVIANPSAYDAIVVRSDHALLNHPNYVGSIAYNAQATFTASDQGGFNSWSSTAPTYAVIKPSDFAAIPEPNAFGLLAGTGALAFAASRRQRREG